MISVDDYLVFVDEALDGMVGIVVELGDHRANQRLNVAGSNSPYAVLTHCLGVMEYWAGALIAGRTIQRDRDGEFRAQGDVATLVERVQRARLQLTDDLTHFEPRAVPNRGPLDRHLRDWPEDADLPLAKSQGGVLIHLYEELAQHRGQMETCRDVFNASWGQFA